MKFGIEDILCDKKPSTQTKEDYQDAKPRQIDQHITDVRQRDEVKIESDYEAEDLMDGSVHRRARTTITNWQRNELEALFLKQRYPAFDKVEELSGRLGLPQYVIKVWFQNRRAKSRKEGRRRSSRLPSQVSMPEPQISVNPFPYMPRFCYPLPSFIPAPQMVAMNQLVQNRHPFTITNPVSASEILNTGCKNQCLDENNKHNSEYQQHIGTDLTAKIDIRNVHNYRHLMHSNEHEQNQLTQCCCMGCRMGTFYTKY